jgi:hypothetical protein
LGTQSPKNEHQWAPNTKTAWSVAQINGCDSTPPHVAASVPHRVAVELSLGVIACPQNRAVAHLNFEAAASTIPHQAQADDALLDKEIALRGSENFRKYVVACWLPEAFKPPTNPPHAVISHYVRLQPILHRATWTGTSMSYCFIQYKSIK